jgi:hypothetical protein
MESSFDLDINNYTTNDLLSFFKLEEHFTLEDLVIKEEKLVTEILSVNNKIYNPKYKFDIINFMKLAKDVLISLHYDIETNKEIKKNFDKFVNKDKDFKVGKIINPLAQHPVLEDTNIPKNLINGYKYNTTTSVYVFNTSVRNDFFITKSSNSTYDLPINWKNVISISLASLIIPNVMYTFSLENGNTEIYIQEDNTGISGIVKIPDGNYSPYVFDELISPVLTEVSFPTMLTNVINSQLGTGNRFNVFIDLANRKTTIYNTTNTFTMITINKITPTTNILCGSNNTNVYNIDFGVNPPPKENLPLELVINTLGYYMGFREILYKGFNSYTSESIFNNKYSDYLYFELEDFTGSQTLTQTYGMLGDKGILKGSILGVIPLDSNIFSPTFDNNANFIYKEREYFGPVDINKIGIKILNQNGDIVNLYDRNFSFSLQVKTIYNLSETSTLNIRRAEFL